MIGNGAFDGCLVLTNINIDAANTNLIAMDNVVFDFAMKTLIVYPHGSSTKYYTIPPGVLNICDNTFNRCVGLGTLTFPASLTTIGIDAFANCSGLTDFIVDSENTNFQTKEGVLFDFGKTLLINYPVGNIRKNYNIPGGVVTIGSNAFAMCSGLKTLTFPDSLVTIESNAFAKCLDLINLTFPASLTNIGTDAFSECPKLASVIFPSNSNLTSIENLAFSGCTSLTNVTFPENLTSIGDYEFSGCTSLTSVTFPINSNLTSIGEYAFSYCTSLTSVTFPINSNLTSIGYKTFEQCTSLTSVTFPENLTSIGEFAF